jgi:hypothetical protein
VGAIDDHVRLSSPAAGIGCLLSSMAVRRAA